MLSCRTRPADLVSTPACCRWGLLHHLQPARVRRYPSDTTDVQWGVIDAVLPDPACVAGRGGRRPAYCRRVMVDAIFYVVDNGIKWRALPADFPPWKTVYNHFAAWEATGTTQQVLDCLRDRIRLEDGRAVTPSAAIIDSQSVKAAETVGRSSRGFDAGKKINGRKRHIAVDTLGLLLCVLVTTACTQDRDGARPLLVSVAASCARLRLVWADGAYAGKLVEWARQQMKVVLEVVKRPDDVTGFVVLPRRWVVERTLAWITQHRRCVRDYERLPAHHEAMVRWAMIRILSRRLQKV